MEPELIYIELIEGGNKVIIDIKKIAVAVMRANGNIEIWLTGDNAPLVTGDDNGQKLWNLIRSRALEL